MNPRHSEHTVNLTSLYTGSWSARADGKTVLTQETSHRPDDMDLLSLRTAIAADPSQRHGASQTGHSVASH